MSDETSVTAVILAGGKSSRMGTDKALLPFGNHTVLEYIVHEAASVFDETLVIVNEKEKTKDLNLEGAKVYEDIVKNKGPLCGIYTGLSQSKTQANCVLTCDMPFVDGNLLGDFKKLWDEDYEVVCFENEKGKPEPFPGLYHRSSRHMIRLLMDREIYAMRMLFDFVSVKTIVLRKETGKVFTNMNTIDDYYQALKERLSS